MLDNYDTELLIPSLFLDDRRIKKLRKLLEHVGGALGSLADGKLLAALTTALGAKVRGHRARCIVAVIGGDYRMLCAKSTADVFASGYGWEYNGPRAWMQNRVVPAVLSRDRIIVVPRRSLGRVLRGLSIPVFVFERDPGTGAALLREDYASPADAVRTALLCAERGGCGLEEYVRLLVERRGGSDESGAVLAHNYEVIKSAGYTVERRGEVYLFGTASGEAKRRLLSIYDAYREAVKRLPLSVGDVKRIVLELGDILSYSSNLDRFAHSRRVRAHSAVVNALLRAGGAEDTTTLIWYAVLGRSAILIGGVLAAGELRVQEAEEDVRRVSAMYEIVLGELKQSVPDYYITDARIVKWERAVLRAGETTITVKPAEGRRIIGILARNIFVPLTPAQYTADGAAPALVYEEEKDKHAIFYVRELGGDSEERFFITKRSKLSSEALVDPYFELATRLYGVRDDALCDYDFVKALAGNIPIEKTKTVIDELRRIEHLANN